MSITVKFIGICTHVRRPGQDGVRIVLVNAEHGAFINDAKIPPHVPTLYIPSKDIVRMEGGMRLDGHPHGLEPTGEETTWRLCGVRLNLEGTVGPIVSPVADIPKMDTKSDESRFMMQDQSSEVTLREQAACYFDIEHGQMTSDHTEHGAIYAILNVETTEAPALRVTCFWNRESVLIHLHPDATIEVRHVGKYNGQESDKDYYLHYRILSNVPEDAWVPEKKGASNRYPGNISIGCSNSQYP